MIWIGHPVPLPAFLEMLSVSLCLCVCGCCFTTGFRVEDFGREHVRGC